MADCENRGGRDPIPPTLYITVIIMIIASFAILVTSFKKGWMQYNLVDSEMMQESHKVPTLAHGLYRWVVAAWSFGIIMYAVHLGRESDVPGWDLRYFTVWNYTTFCVLFILLSLEHVFTYVPRWVSCLSWTLFQVELANAIFLDIVFWAILFPRQHDTEMPRFFITVNVHLVNSVLMLGEVFLGKLLLVPGQIGWLYLYSMIYVAFAWINYSATSDCMPYPFLSTKPTDAPALYFGLTVFLTIIYFAVYGMVRLKERLFRGPGVMSGYAPIA